MKIDPLTFPPDEDQIVDSWEGPIVFNGDSYYQDAESAIDGALDHYWVKKGDDSFIAFDLIPEFAECCDTVPPLKNYDWAEMVINTIDQESMVDDSNFGEFVDSSDSEELNKLVSEWISLVNWKLWEPNGKFIRLRDKCKSTWLESKV